MKELRKALHELPVELLNLISEYQQKIRFFATNDVFVGITDHQTVMTFRGLHARSQFVTTTNDIFIQAQLKDIDTIYTTNGAFAAFQNFGSNGRVVTWGDEYGGANSDAVQGQLHGVTTICSNDFAFAVQLSNGRVVSWGSMKYGGDSSSVQAQLHGVTTIYSTSFAFAAVREDGHVVTWGAHEVYLNKSVCMQRGHGQRKHEV